MKFVKVIVDGKELYRLENEDVETGFTVDGSEYVEVEIEDAQEKSGGDAKKFFIRLGEGIKVFGTRLTREVKGAYVKIADGAKELGGRIKDGTEKIFGRDKGFDPNSTEARLLKILPYMSKEDTHGVCERLLENDASLASLDLATIMPFLCAEDCDALFERAVALGNTSYDLPKAMPFVSEECKTRIVDKYISGEYAQLYIDTLYPYFSDSDIKRLFYHILGSKKNGGDM